MDSLLEPITDTKERPLCTEVMKRLDIQRRNEQFCDVTLEVGSGDDQARLKAHRNVLCAAGTFFFNALNSDMKEKQEGVIRLKETSKSVMEKVLDYLYTGHVEITKEIAYELFAQADFFLLPNLKALASEFILQKLDISNCIMAFNFAINYKDEDLVNEAKDFILANFVAVAGSEDFLNLSIEEIEEWISSDKIVVKEEEDVFRVIVKWMENNNKDTDFLQLLGHVRCTHLSPSYVSDVILQHPLVNGNTACENFILYAAKESSDTTLPMRDCLKTHDVIIASGNRETFCYLPTEDKWYELSNKLSAHASDFCGMSCLNNKLFIVGGCRVPGGHIVECYDPLRNKWTPITAPEIVHRCMAVVTLNGFLYAIGGRDRNKTVWNTVQRFNPGSNQWQEMSPLSTQRSNVCAVSNGRYLYAIGGMSADVQFLDIVERYDPMNDAWSELPSMLARRAFAGGTAIGQKIFVFGGIEMGSLVDNPCEMYDQDTNMWSIIPCEVPLRMNASVVSLKGKVYINGNVQNVQEGDFVLMKHVLLVYDIEKREWKRFPDSKLLNHLHKISTLTIPDNVLAKCKEVSKDDIKERQFLRFTEFVEHGFEQMRAYFQP